MAETNHILEATPFKRAIVPVTRRWFIVKPVPLLLIICFITLTLAILFIFSAKAVKITIIPAPENFSITNGWNYPFGKRYLILPGQYTFTASKQGYEPLIGVIKVNQEPDQAFHFTLRELPGILQITTIPATEAKVFINQQLVGTSPLTLDNIAPGLHDISLRSVRFLDYDSEISIQGQRQENRLVAELTPAWAYLSIESDPIDAKILIDNVMKGTTPGSIEALQGDRSVAIQKPSYKTWQTRLSVIAGEDQTLEKVTLEKADGKVSFKSIPLGANITIDGRYQGQTPLDLKLSPGKPYQVVWSKAGYQPSTQSMVVAPDEAISLNNTLEPILGTLRLSVEPKTAKLFVDGKSRSYPNRRLSLTTKAHEIRITAPGFADYTTRITPLPGAAQQLVVKLLTEAEAKAAAIPTKITATTDLTLKLIVPDKLSMGAGRREPGRRSNEIQRQVILARTFYLSTTEVTNQQFQTFNPSHDSGILGRALLNEANRPVVNLAWQAAAKFCNWLSEQEGLPTAYEDVAGVLRTKQTLTIGYRLPTEAEWAWAARYANGPKPTRFPWGENMPPQEVKANYADESAIGMAPYYLPGYNDTFRGSAPVQTYSANAFGIYDLSGNVAEWIHDYYSLNIPKDIERDPTGPEIGDYHVIRGSSYRHGRFSELRWTYRDYGVVARPDVGFRVARYLE